MKKNGFIILIFVLSSCASTVGTTNTNVNNTSVTVISEMSSSQTTLDRIDIAKFFCNNLTEYFNAYEYYKISSEIYYENEKQSDKTIARVTKKGRFYSVEYIGSAGHYIISFSNNQFSESEQILTFGRQTVLGNAIRGKVYDTFTAWVQKEEIALKANYKSYLYSQELRASVEIENWYNSLSSNGSKN